MDLLAVVEGTCKSCYPNRLVFFRYPVFLGKDWNPIEGDVNGEKTLSRPP
jgi:hypothetical protein